MRWSNQSNSMHSRFGSQASLGCWQTNLLVMHVSLHQPISECESASLHCASGSPAASVRHAMSPGGEAAPFESLDRLCRVDLPVGLMRCQSALGPRGQGGGPRGVAAAVRDPVGPGMQGGQPRRAAAAVRDPAGQRGQPAVHGAEDRHALRREGPDQPVLLQAGCARRARTCALSRRVTFTAHRPRARGAKYRVFSQNLS